MSNILVTIENSTLSIKKIEQSAIIESWSKSLSEFEFKETIDTDIIVDNDDRYKVLLWHEIENNILLVYSKSTTIKCLYTTIGGAYLRLLDRKNQVLSASIDRQHLKITWFGAMRNKFNLTLSDCKLVIDDHVYQNFEMPISPRLLQDKDKKDKKYIRVFTFDTNDFIRDNAEINCRVRVNINVNGYPVEFSLSMSDKNLFDRRDYYIPFSSVYYQNFAMHLRRSLVGNLMFIRRPMEEIEYTKRFQILESKTVSCMLYHLGHLTKHFLRKKTCLFYEKFSEKAEEGAYDVFLEALKSKSSNSYFIIDENSPDFAKISCTPNIVKKYSLKYYWLLYTASSYISTESPTHINVIRSNNHYFRKSINRINFIFLQHGVTYLKCHGRNSPFIVGKEATPSYMIVGSEKEKNVVSEMLGLSKDRIINSGLPIFSKIKFKHLNQSSEDIAVIMLTWKPYEEYLTDFEQSSYYQNIIKIHNILTKYLSNENVIIVAHPKIEDLIKNTPLAKNIWNHPISEVLSLAKLLITDYSSVCYNSFYQGGGVVFFQEDIEYYEQANGKLIPQDDEYIGKRAFSFDELETILKSGLSNHIIHLDKFRTPEFEKRYHSINEFSDGKNIERICNELKELNII